MRYVNVFHEMAAKKNTNSASFQEEERNVDKTKYDRSNQSLFVRNVDVFHENACQGQKGTRI